MMGTFDRKKSNSGGFQPNWGNFLSKGAIVLIILGGTLSLTNPSREEYLNYASGRLAIEAKENWCQEAKLPDILGGISESIVDACQSLVTSQRGTIKGFIDNATPRRQNAVIFSIYTTNLIDHRYRSIGIAGNFLTFSSEKIEEQKTIKPVSQ
ncbi:MAG: DUF4359 domain-containing protein [Cyanobacteriota bacterium]|nr:DUF4359 domain-containing protein [Cyanobacteriota bacterium]